MVGNAAWINLYIINTHHGKPHGQMLSLKHFMPSTQFHRNINDLDRPLMQWCNFDRTQVRSFHDFILFISFIYSSCQGCYWQTMPSEWGGGRLFGASTGLFYENGRNSGTKNRYESFSDVGESRKIDVKQKTCLEILCLFCAYYGKKTFPKIQRTQGLICYAFTNDSLNLQFKVQLCWVLVLTTIPSFH